jgi:hypothetical protein
MPDEPGIGGMFRVRLIEWRGSDSRRGSAAQHTNFVINQGGADMLGKVTLIAGLFAVGTALGGASVSAAPVLPQSTSANGDGSLVLQVGFRHHHHHHHHHHRFHRFGTGVVIYGAGYGYGYCPAWRHECAARWGWATHGFYRCLWRHAC